MISLRYNNPILQCKIIKMSTFTFDTFTFDTFTHFGYNESLFEYGVSKGHEHLNTVLQEMLISNQLSSFHIPQVALLSLSLSVLNGEERSVCLYSDPIRADKIVLESLSGLFFRFVPLQ